MPTIQDFERWNAVDDEGHPYSRLMAPKTIEETERDCLRAIVSFIPVFLVIAALMIAALLMTPSHASAKTVHSSPTSITIHETSSNWSGYIAQGKPDAFSHVAGTFTVPQIAGQGLAAEWVGVDGNTSAYLLQAGVLQSPGYAPMVWYVDQTAAKPLDRQYEALPLPLNVEPGDSVRIVLDRMRGTQWNVVVIDQTTDQAASIMVNYDAPYSSAEWITEQPGIVSNATDTIASAPLLGAVTWSHMLAVNGGQYVRWIETHTPSYRDTPLRGRDHSSFTTYQPQR